MLKLNPRSIFNICASVHAISVTWETYNLHSISFCFFSINLRSASIRKQKILLVPRLVIVLLTDCFRTQSTLVAEHSFHICKIFPLIRSLHRREKWFAKHGASSEDIAAYLSSKTWYCLESFKKKQQNRPSKFYNSYQIVFLVGINLKLW